MASPRFGDGPKQTPPDTLGRVPPKENSDGLVQVWRWAHADSPDHSGLCPTQGKFRWLSPGLEMGPCRFPQTMLGCVPPKENSDGLAQVWRWARADSPRPLWAVSHPRKDGKTKKERSDSGLLLGKRRIYSLKTKS